MGTYWEFIEDMNGYDVMGFISDNMILGVSRIGIRMYWGFTPTLQVCSNIEKMMNTYLQTNPCVNGDLHNFLQKLDSVGLAPHIHYHPLKIPQLMFQDVGGF